MKRFLLTTSFVAPAVFALFHGCATDDGTTTGTGSGTTMTGSSTPTTSGASGATGSSTPTTSSGSMGGGGASTTPVTSTGMGGNGGSSVTSGGGDGGAATTSGGGGGAGGAAGGAGGAAGGAGGAAGGAGGAAGGAGGATGGAGGGGDLIDTVGGSMKSNFGFFWKDSWFLTPCYQKMGADCFTARTCPPIAGVPFEDQGAMTRETFKLGGTAGAHYLVTFKYNAVAEAKYHTAGAFANPTMDLATPLAADPAAGAFNEDAQRTNNNTFYIGGNAITSTYNVYRMRVLDSAGMPVTGIANKYYFNAFPQSTGFESHRTLKISYSHTIEVIGGGSIELQSADSNCRAIDNCGDGTAVTDGACNQVRTLSGVSMLTGAVGPDMAPIPASHNNIATNMLNTITPTNLASWHAQMAHFVITKIVEKP